MAKLKDKKKRNQIAARGNFWTPEPQRAFHKAVAELFPINCIPDGDCHGYRREPKHGAPGVQYVLSYKEELQLADDIAFLFPHRDHPSTVTAVAVEEHSDGHKLVLRFGVNEEPKPEAVMQLKDMMDVVKNYAIEAHREIVQGQIIDKARAKLFDKVVDFRSTRLLQRLQAMTGGTRRTGGSPPLHEGLREHMHRLKREAKLFPKEQQTKCTTLAQRLEQLLPLYQVLDICASRDKKSHLKQAIRASHDLCVKAKKNDLQSGSRFHSLKHQLAYLGFSDDLCQNEGILEVDKIARYYTVCISLLALAQRYQALFTNISVRFCEAPKRALSTIPPGAKVPCHVHGEVRLVMHYEQIPHYPPPRALGSSLSMCFLCDMFIQKHGQYWVSHTHKLLFDHWTIPDVDWMNPQQIARFQSIVSDMTEDLVRLSKRPRRVKVSRPPLSRAPSPFSVAGSTISRVSTIRPLPSVARTSTPVPQRHDALVRTAIPEADPSTFKSAAGRAAPWRIGAPSPRLAPDITPTLEDHVASSETEMAVDSASSKHMPPPATPPEFQTAASVRSSPQPKKRHDFVVNPATSKVAREAVNEVATSLRSQARYNRSPSSSASASTITHLPSTIPLTHRFAFSGPDLELTISKTPFIFEFASSVAGKLSIAWLTSPATVDIDLATLRDKAVRIRKTAGSKTLDFTVRIDVVTAVRIQVEWDSEPH